MYQSLVDSTSRAWKFDNKYVWTLILAVGGLLGYSVPDSVTDFLPVDNAKVVVIEGRLNDLDARVDDLETNVFGTPKASVPVEEPAVTVHKLKIEKGSK